MHHSSQDINYEMKLDNNDWQISCNQITSEKNEKFSKKVASARLGASLLCANNCPQHCGYHSYKEAAAAEVSLYQILPPAHHI